jgi:hypothetical protein
MSNGFIPVFNLNVPNGGNQSSAPIITANTPIYSSYTGNLVSYGNVQKGTISDAPIGNANYGKPYHVIEYNSANNSYMMHRSKGTSNNFFK